jgi:Mg-chelatase subunit ChlI
MSKAARAVSTPFPFAAIVAQDEAKLALLLAAINPRVGGVLLSGPKGTGKTTLVRAAGELLPVLERAACPYGCDPHGNSLCADCAATRERDEPIKAKKVRGEIAQTVTCSTSTRSTCSATSSSTCCSTPRPKASSASNAGSRRSTILRASR